jgi:cytochrome c-type biogenesis protein CcmF
MMAIGPKLKWIKSDMLIKKRLIILFLISFLLSLLLVIKLDKDILIYSILLTFAFYLFFISLRDFFIKKKLSLPQNFAHFGFSLLILSILFNNILSKEIITNLKVGEIYKSEKFEINFENIGQVEKKNFKEIIGKFIIKDSKDNIEILNPGLRIYNQPNIVTSEADIKVNLFEDKFMTMNYVPNQDYFNIRYQIKPFMIWIWFSVLLITFGGIISVFKKRYEN